MTTVIVFGSMLTGIAITITSIATFSPKRSKE